MSAATRRFKDELEEINERGYRHDSAVAERLSLIAEILINILTWTEPTSLMD